MKEQYKLIEQHEEQDCRIDHIPPQVKIYNRNVYLRKAQQQQFQKEIDRQIDELASKPKLTPNSYIILVQKLEQQINKIYKDVLQGQEYIDFNQFQQIFNQLGHFSKVKKAQVLFDIQLISTQFWLILVHYDLKEAVVQKNKVTSLFHILFCPYLLKFQEMIDLIDHAFPDLDQKRFKYIEQYPQASEQVLNSDGLIKLWMKIKRENLCSFAQTKKMLPQQQTPSFKPEITPKSKKYAKKQLQRYLQNNKLDNLKCSKLNELSGYISGGKELSYHQILYKRQLQKQQLLKTNRRDMQPKNRDKTLTAQQTKQLVQNLYIVKDRKEDVDYQKIKEDEDFKKCTFHPQTTEYRKRSKTALVKNYVKQVDRLEEGRKKKEQLKQAYNNLGKVKSKNVGIPPSMVQRQKPRLILQIKLSDRIVQLKLRGDEEPHIVAKKFVIKHGLEESNIEVLEDLIRENIAAL